MPIYAEITWVCSKIQLIKSKEAPLPNEAYVKIEESEGGHEIYNRAERNGFKYSG